MELVPQAFKIVLASRGFRENSVRLYAYYAALLLNYFGCGPRKLDARDVLEWIGYAQNELKWKPRTVNVALAAFRILFDATSRSSVMVGIRNLRFDHPEPRVLSGAEVARIFAASNTATMRAAVALLFGAGLRISELLALRFVDIDSARGVLRIDRTKNRHARDALLPIRALPLLRTLWRVRRAAGGVDLKDLVFVSRAGKALRRDVIASALVQCAETSGVTKRVYPHLLRHSFATSMIEQGTDVTTVQKLLGHRSLSSTARYVHLTAASRAGIKSPLDTLPLALPVK
jgi:site-specific recombinase XerD